MTDWTNEGNLAPLRLMARLKNNRLHAFRKKLGLGVVEANSQLSCKYQEYENLRLSPIIPRYEDAPTCIVADCTRKKFRRFSLFCKEHWPPDAERKMANDAWPHKWKRTALALAELIGEPPEWIWPDEALSVQSPVAEIEISGDAARQLAALARPQLEGELHEVMDKLSGRDRGMLEMHFGLTGDDPMTFADIAREYGLSIERTRQCVYAALHRLRRNYGKRLAAHMDFEPDTGRTVG